MFNVQIPNNTTVSTNDAETLEMMLTMPRIKKYLASAVRFSPDFVVTRRDNIPADDFVELSVEVTSDMDEGEVERVVSTWAARARMAGVRGDRVSIIEEPKVQYNVNDDNQNTYTFAVRLSTAVFYNERRATVNVSSTIEELTLDVEQLSRYISGDVKVTAPFGAVGETVAPKGASLDEIAAGLLTLRISATVMDITDGVEDIKLSLDDLIQEATALRNSIV